jgi:hypothetical protein
MSAHHVVKQKRTRHRGIIKLARRVPYAFNAIASHTQHRANQALHDPMFFVMRTGGRLGGRPNMLRSRSLSGAVAFEDAFNQTWAVGPEHGGRSGVQKTVITSTQALLS